MAIRRAHLATYPARQSVLERAVRSLEPQVDEIHLVLNEFTEIPSFLARFPKVNAILPNQDWKDVGKFITRTDDEDHVFFVDDDLCYSPVYCDWLIERAEAIGMDRCVFGLHACIYRGSRDTGSRARKTLHYGSALRRSQFVDQLGTGTALALGKNIPPLDTMRDAQRFVDVRYAKWCFENGIDQVALARPFHMIRSLRHSGETIYKNFTVASPQHVTNEIHTFAGRSSKVGQRVGQKLGILELFRAA